MRVDVRLAVTALAGWAAVFWALSRTPSVVAAVAAIAVLVAGMCLVAGRRTPLAYLAGLGCAVVATLLIPLSIRIDQIRSGDLARAARDHPTVVAEIVLLDDPRPLTSSGSSGTTRMVVEAKVASLRFGSERRAESGRVLVLAPLNGWQGLLPGQRLHVDARLSPALPGELMSATLSARGSPRLLGDPPWWQRVAGTVRSGLHKASGGLPELPRGLLPGLVVGDTANLDPVLVERFRVAGLTHLVAVSGANATYR